MNQSTRQNRVFSFVQTYYMRLASTIAICAEANISAKVCALGDECCQHIFIAHHSKCYFDHGDMVRYSAILNRKIKINICTNFTFQTN
jgi:hypothetical protein